MCHTAAVKSTPELRTVHIYTIQNTELYILVVVFYTPNAFYLHHRIHLIIFYTNYEGQLIKNCDISFFCGPWKLGLPCKQRTHLRPGVR